jgi:hypothetical protein
MCLAVCNEKLGGCGHMADEKAWSQKERSYYCPVCGQDRLYFLHDYNLEAVVGATMVENARRMLDEYHKKHRGASPPMASKHGNVPSHRATGAFGRRLGLTMALKGGILALAGLVSGVCGRALTLINYQP